MKVVAFDVIGKLAHFRRPDTTATQMTYPFITPTAARGLVGAILGLTDFMTSDRIGLQLLHPVLTTSQQMSMIGKDGGNVFNRPTTIEILVNPGYRIFYTGQEYTDQLCEYLQSDRAVYPTYLGAAYALTKPVLHRIYEYAEQLPTPKCLTTQAVVPIEEIDEIIFEPDRYYCRAGGFMREYRGNRTFEKSIDFLYERDGRSMALRTRQDQRTSQNIYVNLEGATVCLF